MDTNKLHALIATLTEALDAQSIRNTEFTDIKSRISRHYEDLFRTALVDLAVAHRGDDAIYDLYCNLNFLGLHSAKAVSKRLNATALDVPAITRLKVLVEEILPIAELVDNLKPFIVKGRKPSDTPVVENPNKIVKTCPCCFRQIAVQHGTMAHHGYERPGYGYQTTSCVGIRFKPLEESTAGLEFIIQETEKTITDLTASRAATDTVESISVRKGRKYLTLSRTDSDFAVYLPKWIADLDTAILHANYRLASLKKELVKWSK